MQRHRSLTTREGVSVASSEHINSQVFPHYTRGCIEYIKSLVWEGKVPSLYVVYRLRVSESSAGSRSLTIREGISEASLTGIADAMFPHYT